MTDQDPDQTLKVFLVDVEIHQQVLVVATSKQEAEKIADNVYEDDFENGNDRDTSCFAAEIGPDGLEGGLLNCIPWGVDDDHPRRDWTAKQWLKPEVA